jgi:hypothetical protein
MKAFALQNRLCRDLSVSAAEIPADVRQDAINGGLQRLHFLAPTDSKTAFVSLYVSAPQVVTIGVTQGSADITGHVFSEDDQYRTIRVSGDGIDNQIVGDSSLLYPYTGATGTVSATIYADTVALPEPYSELVGDPRILETNRELINHRATFAAQERKIGTPEIYWVEANARNRNPVAPLLIRMHPMPPTSYRMECRAVMAPLRVSFPDLVSPGDEIPMREEEIERFLLPICRSLLTTSAKWRDKETKSKVDAMSEDAQAAYSLSVATYHSTPNNFVRTKPGW